MARAITFNERNRVGMRGNSLHMQELVSAKQFDPNMNRFMRDARQAGVLAVAEMDVSKDQTAPPIPQQRTEAEALATVDTAKPKYAGKLATRQTVELDDISEELIAEINESAGVEARSV